MPARAEEEQEINRPVEGRLIDQDGRVSFAAARLLASLRDTAAYDFDLGGP
jgi:hypothetical protein